MNNKNGDDFWTMKQTLKKYRPVLVEMSTAKAHET